MFRSKEKREKTKKENERKRKIPHLQFQIFKANFRAVSIVSLTVSTVQGPLLCPFVLMIAFFCNYHHAPVEALWRGGDVRMDRTVYVTNIGTNTESEIRSLFAFCGPLTTFTSHADHFLLVFQEAKSAQTALLLDKTSLNGVKITVSLDKGNLGTSPSPSSKKAVPPQRKEFKPEPVPIPIVPIAKQEVLTHSPFGQALPLSKNSKLGPFHNEITPMRSPLFAASPETSVLITDLDQFISDSAFFYFFLFCGEIKQYAINRSKQIGLVHFHEPEAVKIALQLNNTILSQKIIKVIKIKNLESDDQPTQHFISLFSVLVIPSLKKSLTNSSNQNKILSTNTTSNNVMSDSPSSPRSVKSPSSSNNEQYHSTTELNGSFRSSNSIDSQTPLKNSQSKTEKKENSSGSRISNLPGVAAAERLKSSILKEKEKLKKSNNNDPTKEKEEIKNVTVVSFPYQNEKKINQKEEDENDPDFEELSI